MAWEPNRLEQQRLDKLDRLIEAGIDPFPTTVERTHTTAEAIAAFAAVEGNDDADPIIVTVCGRLVSSRDMGKTVFAHIEDGFGRIQLFVRRADIGEESHLILRKLIDLGDFIQATGSLMRTRTGEISIHVSAWKLLAKAVTPLPQAKEQEIDGEIVRYSAFADIEERYRQRYADLAVNRDVRDVFITRAKLLQSLRRYFDAHGFLEVETPVLQPIYGGAAARPFTTYHNQLKQDLYLRISFELYLKRLLVGGIERVYEIGRDFRNEGVSFKHNPEFTQLEFYAAYWNYEDVMNFVENMIRTTARDVLGTMKFTYGDNTIDVGRPWPRITMRDAIKQFAEIDYMEHTDADSLRTALRAEGIDAFRTKLAWGPASAMLFSIAM